MFVVDAQIAGNRHASRPNMAVYHDVQNRAYFVHVTRHDGLEKTIMQGMVAGERSR